MVGSTNPSAIAQARVLSEKQSPRNDIGVKLETTSFNSVGK